MTSGVSTALYIKDPFGNFQQKSMLSTVFKFKLEDKLSSVAEHTFHARSVNKCARPLSRTDFSKVLLMFCDFFANRRYNFFCQSYKRTS